MSPNPGIRRAGRRPQNTNRDQSALRRETLPAWVASTPILPATDHPSCSRIDRTQIKTVPTCEIPAKIREKSAIFAPESDTEKVNDGQSTPVVRRAEAFQSVRQYKTKACFHRRTVALASFCSRNEKLAPTSYSVRMADNRAVRIA